MLISLILFLVLLFLDLSVDTYVEKQLESSLAQKGKALANLIDVKNNQVMLNLNTDLMNEFEVQAKSEYFSLWSNEHVIESSTSLLKYPNFKFPYAELALSEYSITVMPLPDGRSGRVFIYKLKAPHSNNLSAPIYLALARTCESLEKMLVLIDIVFLLTAIATAFFVRYLVNKIVTHGLHPIEHLNQQIREIDFNDQNTCFAIEVPPSEIKTIIDELNQFLMVNRTLLQSEKRLTSDISRVKNAHC